MLTSVQRLPLFDKFLSERRSKLTNKPINYLTNFSGGKIMATGIKDKVAIIGMGCTRFGERWDMGAEELMVEAFKECLDDAAVDKKEIEDLKYFYYCKNK